MRYFKWSLLAVGVLIVLHHVAISIAAAKVRDLRQESVQLASSVALLTAFADSVRTFYRRDLSIERDSLVAEAAREFLVPIEVAVAVSHVENWRGDSTAVSSAGAIGLMQVMPTKWALLTHSLCGPGEVETLLTNRRCNVRAGSLILYLYHRDHAGDWDQALRAYHGSLQLPRVGDRYVRAVTQKRDELF